MQVIGTDFLLFQKVLIVHFIGQNISYTMVKINKQGGVTMKNKKKYPHLTIYQSQEPIYPNAADHRYFAAKALNVMTAIVSGMGFATAMIFLVTMA